MARYQVTMKDRSVEVIAEADAYQQEGPMTTFFTTGPGRQVVDCWSSRVASFRTSEIIIIRRVDELAGTAQPDLPDLLELLEEDVVVGRGARRSSRDERRLDDGRGDQQPPDARPFLVRETAS